MSSDQSPRRFAPTPIETSSKSSRQDAQTNGTGPRKFNVQPVETSKKSNKDTNNANEEEKPDGQSQPRRFAPQPVEISTKSSKDAQQAQTSTRRFAPEPVENSVKSSKDIKSSSSSSPQPVRRFAPEPVESTTKSSRKRDAPEAESDLKPKSRFLPQPVETSTKSSRTKSAQDEALSPTAKPQDAPPEKPKRKFAPQLIDTSSRSRKNSDDKPSFSSSHKTDITPGETTRTVYNNSGQRASIAERERNINNSEHPHFIMPFARRKERSDSARSHSFRMPDLETIESSESEPSAPPSLSTSPSSNEFSLGAAYEPLDQGYKHATRVRESVDETFRSYLLELEARKAQAKLEEQALAAFPNSDYHEPVAHYVDEESEIDELDDRPATWEGHDDEDFANFARTQRERSSTHGTYEIREMQQHHAELEEQERKAAGTTARRESMKPSPWWNPGGGHDLAGSKYPDSEARAMRDRARPPMLGTDLQFPRSASPEPARFDVTQGSSQLRSQMCYLTEQSQIESVPEGLWGGKKPSSQHTKSQHSINSKRSTHHSQIGGGGLWGGFCIDDHKSSQDGLAPPTAKIQTGLMTPAIEPQNPFDSDWALPPPTTLPQTPPGAEDTGKTNIPIILSGDDELDELMDHDYPDSFVTQVYNYLSLGYPSLARPYDEELSKISHIPVSDLRHDDEVAKEMPKGYIRFGEDFEGRGDGTSQELHEIDCARWQALKKYIREWARQEKNMVKTEGMAGNWGTGARRGSWAW